MGDEKYKLAGSFLDFIQVFYKIRTGRQFEISSPVSRPSHFNTIAGALTKVVDGKCKRLVINVPPRYGKTEMLIHFIAWSLAIYPDSNYIYVSYSHSLAKKQTQTIRNIITLSQYRDIFNVHLRDDTQAKDNFETERGGSVYAVGSGGSITGRGAGVTNSNRFSGCIVIDDIHKPNEVSSDTVRDGINEWYYNTLQSRLNSTNTPIIFIGQRLHEDDLPSNLIKTCEWETVILPAIDEAGNALYPEMHGIKTLRKMQQESPYTFAAQYQQDPQPSGGGIFKPEWFTSLGFEPPLLATFITCDTSETDKDYNDATVFSFFGLYRIMHGDIETDLYGLHWLDCLETRIEPKDLMNEFMNFYRGCMQHKVKPKLAAIEKKSTGVTLASSLKNIQGLQILDIERTKSSGNKTSRYLEMQPYISTKRVTFADYAKHAPTCIEHMRKITANNTHRFDDICDTLYDAVKLALIDETIIKFNLRSLPDKRAALIGGKLKQINKIKGNSSFDLPTRNIFQ